MAAAIRDTVNNMLGKLNIGGKKGPSELPAEPPSDADFKELKERYDKAGQGHVFDFWEQLQEHEKGSLYEQLLPIDPEHINTIAQKALQQQDEEHGSQHSNVEQLPDEATTSTIDSHDDELNTWYESGLKLIAENKVAVVLMAGGQGTRLGSTDPKGCFDIGLPSHKSLFQLQAERIRRLQTLANKHHSKDDATIPWYIMTSESTRRPTQHFFEEHDFWGLGRDHVVFFEQGVLPCVSMEGKILLDSQHSVAVAPDGNGGLYQAMVMSGIVQDMQKRGIQHVHAYCVDNCLVRVADPTFIGFSAAKDVDIATKVVRKRNASEKVGLIVQLDERPHVVEYSEISDETAKAKDPKDSSLLKFRAANIVNHYYSFRFLESITDWAHKLPHHVAKKKINCIDSEGRAVKPEKPNGIKLEQFVFDCFPFLDMHKFACMEVRRDDEFSPLKNAKGTGEDDPDTSRRHILAQGRRFVEAAGGTVISEPSKEDNEDETGVEVSPLISYGGEGLEFFKGREVKAPAVVEKET